VCELGRLKKCFKRTRMGREKRESVCVF